jgi:predicted permease
VVAPPDLPRLADLRLDIGTWLATAFTAVASAVVVAFVPSLGVGGALRPRLDDGGAAVGSARGDRLRARFVVMQVALATVLLIGTVFVGRSLLAMMAIDVGYRPQGVVTFQLGTVTTRQSPPGTLTQLYGTLLDRLRALPGVVSVGTSNSLPLHGQPSGVYQLPKPGESGEPLYAQREVVSAAYLETLGATLREGRLFDERDTPESEPVVVVNDLYAQTFLRGQPALGATGTVGVRRSTVVGVVASIKRAAGTEVDYPVMYFPASQSIEAISLSPGRGMGVAVRATGEPLALMPRVRAIVDEIAPGTPIYNVMRLDDRVGLTYAQPRFFAISLTLFATLALATMAVGVYGTLASAVERRRAELGLRRALGATSTDLVALVLGQAVRLAAAGLIIGAVAAAGAIAWGRAALFGVEPLMMSPYLLAIPAILAVVFTGAVVPMRVALRVDPVKVLRSQ